MSDVRRSLVERLARESARIPQLAVEVKLIGAGAVRADPGNAKRTRALPAKGMALLVSAGLLIDLDPDIVVEVAERVRVPGMP